MLGLLLLDFPQLSNSWRDGLSYRDLFYPRSCSIFRVILLQWLMGMGYKGFFPQQSNFTSCLYQNAVQCSLGRGGALPFLLGLFRPLGAGVLASELVPVEGEWVLWARSESWRFGSVQLLSHVQLFVIPWTAACQAFLSITSSWSLLKLMSIESVMPSNQLILCHPLLFLPSIFPGIRVFSNESALHIRWPKYWSFSFSISASSEYSGQILFRMDWLDFLAVQGVLKSLLQHHSSRPSILQCSEVVVWTFFGIAFLWDWNENWPFPLLWPLLSFPNLLAYWVQHFHSIIFQGLK